ncbi:MAG TPA: FAD-dependent oxidoreductase [Steroidobacteraceae bacterium]|nr:FAD-dependent oxidoreductase [Steroidobacteraceae bacterium]
MSRTFVVAGGGHAGGQAVDSLRREGFDGRLVLVAEEPALPYHRPPLSKKYLAGELARERLYLRQQAFYDQHAIELRLGTRVTAIDRERRRVRLDDGDELDYDGLMLCLGSRVRRLNVPGAALPGVHYLRNLADVDRIRAEFAPGRRLVVIGAGYIGLEAAASARTLGLDVTVLEMADRPMSRVVAPVVSRFYADRHTAAGVDLRCGTSVAEILGDARVTAVRCGDGTVVPADFVIAGVGIEPETTLAAAAGLACDDGILVDEQCRTSDPAVFAAGDCTNHPSVRYGRRIRLESVDNALEQARTAAATMCGRDAGHAHVPWFWSDQYDIKLQIAGVSQGHDQVVVRGNPERSQFSVWYLLDGELLAVDAINRPGEFMHAKRWIAERKRPDPVQLGDPAVELKMI